MVWLGGFERFGWRVLSGLVGGFGLVRLAGLDWLGWRIWIGLVEKIWLFCVGELVNGILVQSFYDFQA